ncbi:LysM peptidoglycan-binding domain-containing protein [Reinekea marinisedimentorum]|uniref:LysM domain-containing protein n=1 Tax=Reinekea marinisedimentorum TaxID=230495 RepID=A0A4R3I7S2_9GAMM|nr:LysM peptidoglycan-binding domain-containing protein [Reinekea marinisedimentorum]TCS41304.1 LysM domain-containing protein [Reinekea marinisedimentorum]
MATNTSITELTEGKYGLDILIPAMADGNGSGLPFICLPLYTCESVKQESVQGSANTQVQYANVALHYEDEDDLIDVTKRIRDGWLYIFVNGYLWHEYQVKEGAENEERSHFFDVDLRYWQTKDTRKANSTSNYNITFPTKLDGVETQVQIAYSEVQWSWSRICSMGGMNPEDPRLSHVVKHGEVLSVIANQYSFVESYQELAELNDLDSPDQIKPGQSIKLRDADEPIGDTEANRTSRLGKALKDQGSLGGDYGVVKVQDPLGVIDRYNTAMTLLLMNQQSMLAEMQGSFIPEGEAVSRVSLGLPYPYLLSSSKEHSPAKLPVDLPQWKRKDICDLTDIARYSYATYLDNDSRNAMDAKDIKSPEESLSEAQDRLDEIKEKLEDTGDRLNKIELENWLRVSQRSEIRQEYRDFQTEYINLVCGDTDPFETYDFSIKLFDVLQDFAWLPSDRYHLLWSRIAEVVNHLVIDPSTFDHQYDLKAVPDRERKEHLPVLNKGLDIAESIYSGSHPCSSWLFPKEEDVDITSDQPPALSVVKSIYSPAFRLGDFQRAIANRPDEKESIDGEKNFFDFFNRFSKTVSALAENFQYRSSEPIKKSITLLFRLAKGSGIPGLEGLHIVMKGESLEGKVALGKYRLARIANAYYEKQNRSQRKFLSAESAFNQQQGRARSQVTELLDSEGKVVAASDIGFLKPWQGFDPNREAASKELIFEQHGKTGNSESIIRAALDVWVIPERSRLNGLYKAASQATSNQLYVGTTSNFPKIMLLFEVIALKEALNNFYNSHPDDLKELSWRFRAQAVNTLAAIIDVTDAWYDSKAKNKLIHTMEKSNFKSIRFLSRQVPIKIRGTLYKVPIIRWLGPIGSLVGAGFTAWDSYKLFKRHDGDAAILTGVVALLGVAGAAIGIIGGSMAGVSLVVPLIGWAIFGISLAVIWAVNKWLKDSPSEYWAEHSPFSNSVDNRLGVDEFNIISKSKAGLQNIIMQPSASVTKEKYEHSGRLMHRVSVIVEHPAFILDESTLDWECTSELIEMMPNGANGMLVPVARNRLKKMKPVFVSNDLQNTVVTRTVLVFSIPDATEEKIEMRFLPDKTIFKENEWHFKFRHILNDGTSLPLNASDFDQDTKTDVGWSKLSWTTS